MIKKLILFLLLVMIALPTWAGGIVNNSGTSSEDSVNVIVLCTDTLNNPIICDSFYVMIFKSGTNAVAFADSGDIDMAGMDSVDIGGVPTYYYHRAVADIDGGGAPGPYAGLLIARATGWGLDKLNKFDFQVVSLELDDQLQEIADGLDTLQNQDDSFSEIYQEVQNVNGVSFPSNFADLAITISTGLVDVNTKTGFSLVSPQTFNLTGDITGNLSGSVGSIAANGIGVGSFSGAAHERLWGGDSTKIAYLDASINTVDSVVDAIKSKTDSLRADSLNWAMRIIIDSTASVAEVWYNQDTTNVDSSALGLWLANNSGGPLISFWGACDECYQRLYPEDGSANKDSAIVINPSLGADSLVGKIVWKHSNTASVYDTAYYYKAPWW